MRPARLDPSALSPSEHEAYETWINELETYLGRLQRALRIGELLAFIRKRTLVDREAEITAFFGNGAQQQSLGVQEFLAVLRLLAHARTCSTLTRDHIFIQTSPLVLTTPVQSSSGNPFFRSQEVLNNDPVQPPPKKLVSGAPSGLRDAAASKKRAPAPPPPASSSKPVLSPIAASPLSGSTSPTSLVTPIAGQNPFRRQQNISSQSTDTVVPSIPSSISTNARLPPTPPESIWTAKSPPLPPRPPQKPTEPPPKHVSQQFQYQKLAGEPSSSIGGPTPTVIKPYSVPAPGPTSIDIISSSVIQPQALQAQSTGQSNASSTTATRLVHQNTGGNRKSSTINSLTDLNVRLLGSSHIGLDSTRLRKHPSPASSALQHAGPRYSPSSDDLGLSAPRMSQKRSDSSLSSLSGMLPRLKRGDTVSSGLTASSSSLTGDTSRDTTIIADRDDGSSSEDILSSEYTAKPSELARSKTVTNRSSRPPPPPPTRRRPESLYVSTDPNSRSQKLVFGGDSQSGIAGRGPYTATSISSNLNASAGRDRPYHARSASLHTASGSSQLSSARPSRQYRSEGLQRHASTHSARPAAAVDALLHKGRDVSQEWLEKARAATAPRTIGSRREDKESLISRGDNRVNEEDDDLDMQPKSVQERRRELERLRSETEPGWSRLE